MTKTDAPYFCNNVLHSLFSDCTVSANGLKISSANGNYAHKSFIETEFSHNKDAKSTWLACQGYSYEANPGGIVTLRISFGRSVDDFSLISDDAAKSYKMKITEANFYVRKMTLNDDVVSAIEAPTCVPERID